MIQREQYLSKLRKYRNKQVIKVITGIRRCGKSTLLKLFQRELAEDGVEQPQMIYLNFEDMDNSHLLDAKALHQYIKDRLQPGNTYVFLDEVQMVPSFEMVVNSLLLRENVDVYVTGSNAHMLSGEIATLLSGRYVEIKMLPLSFKEFVSAQGKTQPGLSSLYKKYITSSSFPYVLELEEDRELIRDYLEGVFSTVVLKDIMARKKIGDVMMLESVIKFLFDSIGSLVSTKKISDTMISSGRKIAPQTVESYIERLMESYVVYQTKRFDVKGKQHLKTLEKYYVADVGLRFHLLGNRQADTGHLLENVIYLELLRRGYDVFIGKVDQYEVDFIALSREETLYIQVAATVRSKDTLERELRPLQMIRDHHAKMILTLDEDPEMNIEGIRVVNALDFLMQ
ncbi:MAG: ATP-binding protein [Tindallia sp. MSAO_Bac2]|nr:MAG: ATP-binding protein [Tindallia sp. MSAO_Bac2]